MLHCYLGNYLFIIKKPVQVINKQYSRARPGLLDYARLLAWCCLVFYMLLYLSTVLICFAKKYLTRHTKRARMVIDKKTIILSLSIRRVSTMQKKLINALADVLGVDLAELQDMSEQQQLAHLEAMQAQELATV